MALKATIFKVSLQIADMDRPYYGDHTLTIARHPSENDERMLVRVLAFALYASDALQFGKGLSDVAQADLLEPDLTGALTRWIEVGQPDERTILKACGRAAQMIVIAYSSSANLWWSSIKAKLERARNLTVLAIPAAQTQALAAMAQRNMQLQCTIQDAQVWFNDGHGTVQIDPAIWLAEQKK